MAAVTLNIRALRAVLRTDFNVVLSSLNSVVLCDPIGNVWMRLLVFMEKCLAVTLILPLDVSLTSAMSTEMATVWLTACGSESVGRHCDNYSSEICCMSNFVFVTTWRDCYSVANTIKYLQTSEIFELHSVLELSIKRWGYELTLEMLSWNLGGP